MIRKLLKKTSDNKTLRDIIKKYKVPQSYFATNRKMVTRAVYLGLFIAFIPMPMQMLAVISFVPFFKFNVPIGLAMCWFTNPFTMPPLYYVEYLTGSFFLGTKVAPVEMTMDWFTQNIDNIFIPLYTGTAFFSIVGSTLAYLLVNFFWKRSVLREKSLKGLN